MTVEKRVKNLEKKKRIKEPEKINVYLIGKDPDPDYVIINPYSQDAIRMLRSEYEAEQAEKRKAGETIIHVGYAEEED
jgi:hypothetical protein